MKETGIVGAGFCVHRVYAREMGYICMLYIFFMATINIFFAARITIQ